jgi:pseudouridine synthase
MQAERLNRYPSQAASVSRRTADELIRAGRVVVDGAVVLEPGVQIDPGLAQVRLDGNTLVPVPEEKVYVMLFKPDNVVTTMHDKEGRKTVASLVSEIPERVVPVGRLDYHTTGLLLLTNDGELAYRLTHPRFGIEKTYVAKLQGVPHHSKLNVLRRGLPIDGVMTHPAQVSFLEAAEGKSWVSIRIAEGRYHQVRRMFEAIGHRVMKLRRTHIGPLSLEGVEPGQWRYLTGKEVREIKSYVERKEAEAQGAPMAKAAGPPHGSGDRRSPTPRRSSSDRRSHDRRQAESVRPSGKRPSVSSRRDTPGKDRSRRRSSR